MPRIQRRQFLRLATGSAAFTAALHTASAQIYPTRPIRFIVGYPAGGIADTVARIMGSWLSERLGQAVLIENRGGAGSTIGTEIVVRASADGYTLLLVTSANAINATLYHSLNYNFLRDVAPVAGINRLPLVMVVNLSIPARTVPEFIAYAKDNPGKINMASVGNGTSPHVAGELFNMMTGVNTVHVPYRGGGPALVDLLAGNVHVFFPGVAGYIEHIRTGKLRALAVTSSARLQVLPDVPPMNDFLPNYEGGDVYGVGAPKGTPGDIVHKLNREINAALVDPTIKARLAELGMPVIPGSPADFGALMATETEKWAKVVKFSGAKVD